MNNIIQKIVDEGLAENSFAATHIANGLHLAQLPDEEKQMERVRLYRLWRHAGENSKWAYLRTLRGETPLMLPGIENVTNKENIDGIMD
jgi:hypothetical protein